MYNASMDTLALFPLNTVLFPGQLLPLNIFEPRYRQMIGECMQHAQPFGVVLIQSGEEVGEPAIPHAVGTAAHIVQVERQEDGRMQILCVGRARFRLQEVLHDKPYLRGTVAWWPWEPFAAGHTSVNHVQQQLGRYLHMLTELTGNQLDVDLPADPAALASAAAAVLQVDLAEKQRLLTTASIGDLLDDVSIVLQRELRAWQIVQASRELSAEDTTPFSLN